MQRNGTILFVESDLNQLQSLDDQRARWRPRFAEDSDRALTRMPYEPVDILVSETRLSRSSGSKLLKPTLPHRPLVTRLLFSGQSVRKPTQGILHNAHQFTSKPCDRTILIVIPQRPTTAPLRHLRSPVDNRRRFDPAVVQINPGVPRWRNRLRRFCWSTTTAICSTPSDANSANR